MRRDVRTLENKKAFSYILVCVVIIVLVMFVSVFIQYAFVYHIANTQKEETQLKLDGYVTRYAIEKYNALKQGAAYDEMIEREKLVDGAYTLLGFKKSGGVSRTTMTDGEKVYTMSKPTVTALDGDSFGVKVNYHLSIPFEVFGKKVADIDVPVEIISKYTER